MGLAREGEAECDGLGNAVGVIEVGEQSVGSGRHRGQVGAEVARRELDGMQVEEDVFAGLSNKEEVDELAMVWEQVGEDLGGIGEGEIELAAIE